MDFPELRGWSHPRILSIMTESPVSYFGGKSAMVADLVAMMPHHQMFVDVFGGGGSVTLGKPSSPVEIYNDINFDLANFFRVVRSDDLFDEFYKRCVCTPYSRHIYYECKERLREFAAEDNVISVDRAWVLFVVLRMAFASDLTGSGWSFSATMSRRQQMPVTISKYISAIERLPEVRKRLRRVCIENHHFREIIQGYDTPETLFYLDPPYVSSTRRGGGYVFEMVDDEHRELVGLLLNLKGAALLSGYAHEIYTPLEEAGWRRCDFSARCRSYITKGKMNESNDRIECVWVSPSCDAGRGFF